MTAVSTPDTVSRYRLGQSRRLLVLVFATAILLVTALYDLVTGPSLMPVSDVWSVISRPADFVGTALYAIVIDIRLPMTLTALTVGASLGIAGAEMQAILRNPLASPYTLGISAAAGFGASTAILTGIPAFYLGWLGVPVSAFVTALAACLGVWAIGRARGVATDVLILSGIAMLFLFQSLQSLVQYMAAPEILHEIVFWLFGSLLKANWTSTWVTAAVLAAVLPLMARDAWRLTVLSMGEENARSLGLDVARLRLRMLVLISVLTASAVAFVGTVGFVGLVAPHIARGFVGEDQRYLIPLSAICGGFIMVGSSVLAKLISPGAVVPIGIVTALIGVPFLFFLILRKKRF